MRWRGNLASSGTGEENSISATPDGLTSLWPAPGGSSRWYLLSILAPFTLYVSLSAPLLHWFMDDAGISFAYARSLINGYGLVSQPGMIPVEGFSNFLWVVLVSPLFLLKVETALIGVKVLSLLLVLLTFGCVGRCILFLSGSRLLVALTLGAISLNSPFTIWTSSGLENPLTVALLSMLMLLQLRFSAVRAGTSSLPIGIGLVAALLALTRPDGILYALSFPITLIFLSIGSTIQNRVGRVRCFVTYLASLAGVLVPFLLFRWFYFDDLVPNTYYAKGASLFSNAWGLLRLESTQMQILRDLMDGIAGHYSSLILPLLILAWIFLARDKKTTWRPILVIGQLYLWSIAAYLLLPQDWMGEFRFATAVVPLHWTALTIFAHRLASRWMSRPTLRLYAVGAFLLVMTAVSTMEHYPRLRNWHDNPRIPMSRIAREFGFRFNTYAQDIGSANGSILLPDLGGTLLYSILRVYDLAGLCDKTIANSRPHDLKTFHNYVSEEIRPTFIHTHGYFTRVSRLDEDPRFQSDYVSIHEYADAYAERFLGRPVKSGDYVRRDAVLGKEGALESWRQEFK